MFAPVIQTGLRISELIGLTVADIHLGPGPHVHCVGKGRKERRTPLLAATVTVLRFLDLGTRRGRGGPPARAVDRSTVES